MSEVTTQDQTVVSAPSNQAVSLGDAALTRRYAKLATKAALLDATNKGGKDLEQYEADLADLYRKVGTVGAKFSAATQVSAAYLVRALDMAAGGPGKLGTAERSTVQAALKSIDADGAENVPSPSRISQFRLSAVVIFDREWPMGDSDFGPMLTTRQNAKGMSAAIKADGATVDSIRAAWARIVAGKTATVIEGSGTDESESDTSEPSGTGAVLPEGEVTVRKSAKSILDEVETLLASLPVDITVDEWIRTHALIERIEAALDSAECKAEGMAALKA